MKGSHVARWVATGVAQVLLLFAAYAGLDALGLVLRFWIWFVHAPIAAFVAVLVAASIVLEKLDGKTEATEELHTALARPRWFRRADTYYDLVFALTLVGALGWWWTAAAYWFTAVAGGIAREAASSKRESAQEAS